MAPSVACVPNDGTHCLWRETRRRVPRTFWRSRGTSWSLSYGHRPLPAEVPLVALALARYGVKFNLSSLPSRRGSALVARGGRGGSPGKGTRTTRRSVAASGAVVVLRVMRPRAVGTRASGGVGRTGPASDVVVGRRPQQKAERPQPKAERPQPTVERSQPKVL